MDFDLEKIVALIYRCSAMRVYVERNIRTNEQTDRVFCIFVATIYKARTKRQLWEYCKFDSSLYLDSM